MKFNPLIVLNVFDGTPLQEMRMGSDGKPELTGRLMTIGGVVVNALGAIDPKLKGEAQVERMRLAFRIRDAEGPIEIKAEEAVLIKEAVAREGRPLITVQIWDAIKA